MRDLKVWTIVPAAGIGRRFGSVRPKQYVHLCGEPLLAHVLRRLLSEPRVDAVVVALAVDDSHWEQLLPLPSHKPIWTTTGGAHRGASVLAGLQTLAEKGANDNDWVLVHDAARPCLCAEDLRNLIDSLYDDQVGGLLATPLVDTLKRSQSSQRVEATVPRTGLWRALTPQMFHFGPLRSALLQAEADGIQVTDESMAMELAGLQPRLICGSGDNIKVTGPDDLALAEGIISGLSSGHKREDV